MGRTSECLAILDKWIVECKREFHTHHIKSSDVNELENYRQGLEDLERELVSAIKNEITQVLQDFEWPLELMECIKEINIQTEIIDRLHECLYTHPFNRSPEHENELRKENEGLQ